MKISDAVDSTICKAASAIVEQPDDANRFHVAREKLKEAYKLGRDEAEEEAREREIANLPHEGTAAVD